MPVQRKELLVAMSPWEVGCQGRQIAMSPQEVGCCGRRNSRP
jgi:hypothetical protein